MYFNMTAWRIEQSDMTIDLTDIDFDLTDINSEGTDMGIERTKMNIARIETINKCQEIDLCQTELSV